VSGVQITHRRHEADALVFSPPFLGEPLHGGQGRNDLHEIKMRQ